MNRLKSIYIMAYPTLALAAVVLSLFRLSSAGGLQWWGPLLATVPFLVLLSGAMLFKNVARTHETLPVLELLSLAGVALSAYFLAGSSTDTTLPFGLSIGGALMLSLYTRWYSKLDRPVSATLVVGEMLPALDLTKTDGGVFRTREMVGQPALIFFYRGNWCPLCMAQIKEVAASYQELSALGVQVLMISPQPEGHSASLAKKFDVDFEFLTDTNNQAANLLNIAMNKGLPVGMEVLGYDTDTVLPTVIVLDAQGIIRWLDQTDNYRVRPEPETFLPLLRELAA